MLRSLPTTFLAFLLLVCLLPASAHLDACAAQHAGEGDDACSIACCQSFTVIASLTTDAPPSLEQIQISRVTVHLPIIPGTLFRPPKPS
jgi:hypothetical protein